MKIFESKVLAYIGRCIIKFKWNDNISVVMKMETVGPKVLERHYYVMLGEEISKIRRK